MPNLYNGYCYETINELADDYIAEPPQVTGDFIVRHSSYTINGSTVNFGISVKSITSTSLPVSQGSYARSFPSCGVPGFVHTQSGVSVTDALEVSWSIVLVWLAAFYFKNLRTGARGY